MDNERRSWSRNGRLASNDPERSLQLVVKNFAQLANVVVPLRDLVVLVGPQATGKSLLLELLKLVIDRNRVLHSLRQHGFTWDAPEDFVGLYFGGGFEKCWTSST